MYKQVVINIVFSKATGAFFLTSGKPLTPSKTHAKTSHRCPIAGRRLIAICTMYLHVGEITMSY